MPAPTGNTNAEKWTHQYVLDKLKEMEPYVLHAHIFTLRSALTRVGLYYGIWNYWKKRWADNEDIMHRMYWIDDVFISKIEEGALCKRLHGGMAMFILRDRHRDKNHQNAEQDTTEKLLPHLQAKLDLAEAAKKAEAAEAVIVKEEPQTTPPAKPAAIPNHSTLGKLTYAPHAKLTRPVLQRPKEVVQDTDVQQAEHIVRRAAA